MKFLLTYASTSTSQPPDEAKMAAIGALVQRNMQSGKLLMTGGLVRPTRGVHLRAEGGQVSVVDGPFAETKELIDGFALVKVESREEALAMATEFMGIAGDGVGEVLQVFDQADMQR